MLAPLFRLSAADRDGHIHHVQILHPATLEPTKDLLVRMLRLIAGGIPVERIKNSPFASRMPVHREQMVHHARHRLSNQWNETQPGIDRVECRNGNTENSMKKPRRHAMREIPIQITK